MLPHLALRVPRPLATVFPWTCIFSPFSSPRWLGCLHFDLVSFLMPRDTLAPSHHCLACSQAKSLTATDHPDFLQAGDRSSHAPALSTQSELLTRPRAAG